MIYFILKWQIQTCLKDKTFFKKGLNLNLTSLDKSGCQHFSHDMPGIISNIIGKQILFEAEFYLL